MQPDSGLRTYRHESALGSWSVSMRPPHPALAGVVSQIWHGAGRVAYARDRILPRAVSYLLINLGPPQYMVLPGAPEQRLRFDDIWYSGLYEGPIDTEAPCGNVLLGVAFQTTGAAAILPFSQPELANRTGSLADMLGTEACELRERLLETRSVAARFDLVERWLLRRCGSHRPIHAAVRHAAGALAASDGRARIEALARDAGYSRKHLIGLFRNQVGLTPKALARVYRFQHAWTLLQSSGAPSLGELADACGYYDQSHLVRDFRQFAGLAPGELARHAQADASSVVLR